VDEDKNIRRRNNAADYFDSSIIGFFTFSADGFVVTDATVSTDCNCNHPIAAIGTICFDAHSNSRTFDNKPKTEDDTFRCTISANSAVDGYPFRITSNDCEFTVARSGEGIVRAKVTTTGLRQGHMKEYVEIALRVVSENKIFVLATNQEFQLNGEALRNFRQFDPFNIRGGEKRIGEYSTGTMMGFHDDGSTAPSSADFQCPMVYPTAPLDRDGDSDRDVGFARFDASSERNERKHNAKGEMHGGPGMGIGASQAFPQSDCCEFGDNPFDSDHLL